MASLMHTTGAKEVSDTTIDYLANTIKVMLIDSTYVINRDTDVVDGGGASDPLDGEISVTGYTGGWGGAGRKTLASKTVVAKKSGDTPANTVVFDGADITWTALGTGTTIETCSVIKEGVANDTTSRMIASLDVSQVTNGSDVTLQFAATDGIFKLNTA